MRKTLHKPLFSVYRVDRQCLFFGNPPGIHRESTFWKVAKIIGKSSTSKKPFEGGFPVDSHPFSTKFRYWFSNFLKVDSQPFSNMVFATFQDFELDLELHCYGQGCQRRQLCFLLLCGRVQSNYDNKEILLLYLLVDHFRS